MESTEKKQRLDSSDENEYDNHDMLSKEISCIPHLLSNDLSLSPTEEYTRRKISENWNQKAIIDGFLVGPLKYMNPFLAMKTFSGVSRIARALSTDKTIDGYILWTSYMKRYNLIPIEWDDYVRSSDSDFNKLILSLKDKIPYYEEIAILLTRAHNDDFGLDKNPRHIFMWLWMTHRVITREACRCMNVECYYNANMIICDNKSTNMEITLAKRSTIPIFIPSTILLSDLPTEYKVKVLDVDGNMCTIASRIHSFKILFRSFRSNSTTLSRSSQLVIYPLIKPIFDILQFKFVCDALYTLANTNIDSLITCIKGVSKELNTSYLFEYLKHHKSNGSLPPFILDHGEIDIYDHIAIQQDIVNTTYPRNPDCGPGIYLG